MSAFRLALVLKLHDWAQSPKDAHLRKWPSSTA